MEVTNLSTQLGLGSKLVDSYRDATSVPFGHLLIDFTDGRLRYCTNTGSIPSKHYIPDRLKQSKFLDNGRTKSFYSASLPIIFPQMKNLFLESCPKQFVLFLCECIINLLKGNLQSIKSHHLAIFQSTVWLLSLKRTT